MFEYKNDGVSKEVSFDFTPYGDYKAIMMIGSPDIKYGYQTWINNQPDNIWISSRHSNFNTAAPRWLQETLLWTSAKCFKEPGVIGFVSTYGQYGREWYYDANVTLNSLHMKETSAIQSFVMLGIKL